MKPTPSLELAREYMRLGGHRRAVIDDNLVSTRRWEEDSPEAKTFWAERIDTLPPEKRKEVELFLPTINTH
jgi:hypothetical protein